MDTHTEKKNPNTTLKRTKEEGKRKDQKKNKTKKPKTINKMAVRPYIWITGHLM